MTINAAACVPFIKAAKLNILEANGTKTAVTLDEMRARDIPIKPVPRLRHNSGGGGAASSTIASSPTSSTGASSAVASSPASSMAETAAETEIAALKRQIEIQATAIAEHRSEMWAPLKGYTDAYNP